MRELSLHILDLLQNSIAAGAGRVEIIIEEEPRKDLFSLEIIDDGRGMSREVLEKAADPFQTSRKTREVGLGLSLLEAAASRCGGGLEVSSAPGRGTRVRAVFSLSHLDRAPLGDISSTIISVLAANRGLDIIYRHTTSAGEFSFDSREIRKELDGITLDHPQVLEWIEAYLKEGLAAVGENLEVNLI